MKSNSIEIYFVEDILPAEIMKGSTFIIAPAREGSRIIKWEHVNVFGNLAVVIEYEKVNNITL